MTNDDESDRITMDLGERCNSKSGERACQRRAGHVGLHFANYINDIGWRCTDEWGDLPTSVLRRIAMD